MPSRADVLNVVHNHVFSVLDERDTIRELERYGPDGFDWNERVRRAASILLPVLVDISPALAEESVSPFNAAAELLSHLENDVAREAFAAMKQRVSGSPDTIEQWIKRAQGLARLAGQAVPNVESQQVSAEARRFLLSDRGLGNLVTDNGNSIYPDLLLSDFDYSFLPFQSRSDPIHGPCLRNPDAPRPSNVPDGCEIKTNKSKRLRVDAHGAHPGLHLGITWGLEGSLVGVHDVWIAYIRESDYSISDGRVDVTTKKRSFGHTPFISLLRGAD